MYDFTHGCYRRTEEGCRHRWRPDWAKFKKRMPKSRDCRENYKHWGYVTFSYTIVSWYTFEMIVGRVTTINFFSQAETDVKIAGFQQQLQERDAEINRLQTEQRVRDKTTMKNSHIIVMIFFFVVYRIKLPPEMRMYTYLQFSLHLRSPRYELTSEVYKVVFQMCQKIKENVCSRFSECHTSL